MSSTIITRERFHEILKEEGVLSPQVREDFWSANPSARLDEERLRRAVKKLPRR